MIGQLETSGVLLLSLPLRSESRPLKRRPADPRSVDALTSNTAVNLIVGTLLGASFGSFVGCAAYRLPRRIRLVRGRSFCPSCRRAIPAHHNLPILSWIWLRGRSACCAKPISPSYLLIEALFALLGGLGGYAYGWLIIYIKVLVLIVLIVVVSMLSADRDPQPGE
jgi:prepilin signal peptidase PulO-like enzyme (type II secretory pathway)